MSSRGARGFRALLGEAKWRELLKRGVERVHRRGSLLLQQGEPGMSVLALIRGRVKVLGAEPDGGQLLLTLRGSGDLLGEIAARSSAPRTATVQAVDECTTHSISARSFNAFLSEIDGHAALADYVVSKLSQTVPYQVQLIHFSPDRRIARLLLEIVSLAELTADPARVPFSQQEVADALGMARSTVAHHLQQLKDAGALRTGPRIVVASIPLLRQVAGV
nr:Crp/Fnr family transcriptional regulator [Allokutzneria sp. NRRL B-24872]